MSDINKNSDKPQIAGAICGPPHEPNISENGAMPQPKQPTSLHGLLKFAMETTKSEDAPQESRFLAMDEERKKFLENAVKSLTVDVIEELMKQIRILQDVSQLPADGDASKYATALEVISDYVCDIDTANDFHKIGGFTILFPCLKCPNDNIRASACNLLAELTQNNPYCQRVVLENGFMPVLMRMIDEEESDNVTLKAIYAVSCIVRENQLGFNQLIQYCGIQVFLDVLRRNEDKFTTKVCFLLSSLCSAYPDFCSRLVFVGYAPTLLTIVATTRDGDMEYALELLVKLMESSQTAISECREPVFNFKGALKTFMEVVKDKESRVKELEHCTALYNILFPENN